MIRHCGVFAIVLAVTVGAHPAWAFTSGGGSPGDLLRTFEKAPPTRRARFGKSVAGVGGNVLIGASRGAAAYIYDPASGQLLTTIHAPGGPDSAFGWAAAGNATTAFVATSPLSSEADRAGTVYAYDPATAALLRTFRRPEPFEDDRFGFAIAATDDKLFVGQPSMSNSAVHLFNAHSGELQLTIPNPSPTANNGFGRAVAFVGDDLLVGAPGNFQAPNPSGVAYLFDGATGQRLQTFRSPNPLTSDRFGFAVSQWNGNVLIGAPQDRSSPINSGAAYLFNSQTGALMDTYYSPINGGTSFGFAVAALNGNALISGGGYANNTDGGAVFGFSPAHQLTLIARNPRPDANTSFGDSPLGIVGDNFVVGAWQDSSVISEGGIAYMFAGPVPEPGTGWLLVGGLATVAHWRPKRGV